MGTLALIGLGSNVGDRQAHLDRAVADLAATPGITVRAVSSYHETAPVGGPEGQGPFLNAAARLDSDLDPFELLRTLRSIEAKAGRVRTVRWGERPLDLDLLIFGCKRLHTPELILPHPRMAVRRFVLAPLAEIAPDIVDTRTGLSIEQLLANLDRRPSYVAIDGPPGNLRDEVFHRIVAGLPTVGLRESDLVETDDDDGPFDLRFPPLLRAKARILEADRWTTTLEKTRWLVTNFTLTAATVWFEDLGIGRQAVELRHEMHRSIVDDFNKRAFRPTMIVALPGGIVESEILRSGLRRNMGDVTLTPESTTAAEIAREALAACAASRPG
jgi:2-amino-4-hydroxy-6-hydroxymethyldihydropteridine diphosphokinase